MSANHEMVNVEVILTLSYPIPADLAEREDFYGTTDLSECVQIGIDNDPVALLRDSTLVNVQVGP